MKGVMERREVMKEVTEQREDERGDGAKRGRKGLKEQRENERNDGAER